MGCLPWLTENHLSVLKFEVISVKASCCVHTPAFFILASANEIPAFFILASANEIPAFFILASANEIKLGLDAVLTLSKPIAKLFILASANERKLELDAVLTLSKPIAKLSLRTTWHTTCCTCKATDVLHMICTRLLFGQVRMRGDSWRLGE